VTEQAALGVEIFDGKLYGGKLRANTGNRYRRSCFGKDGGDPDRFRSEG
jgi:hypothetical protein